MISRECWKICSGNVPIPAFEIISRKSSGNVPFTDHGLWNSPPPLFAHTLRHLCPIQLQNAKSFTWSKHRNQLLPPSNRGLATHAHVHVTNISYEYCTIIYDTWRIRVQCGWCHPNLWTASIPNLVKRELVIVPNGHHRPPSVRPKYLGTRIYRVCGCPKNTNNTPRCPRTAAHWPRLSSSHKSYLSSSSTLILVSPSSETEL